MSEPDKLRESLQDCHELKERYKNELEDAKQLLAILRAQKDQQIGEVVSMRIIELESELQRYKDALEACKEVITRLGGCVCDDCIERELAAIQATKDKKGN